MTDVEIYAFLGKWAGYAITTFVFAGGGAYFGAYLRKKGENLATHEDLDALVEQMKAVTNATKQIEAQISTDVWHRQSRWEMRKTAILEALRDFATAGPLVWKLLWTLKNHGTDSEDDRNARAKAQEDFQAAMEAFWKSKLTATIVCGPRVSTDLNEVDRLLATVKTKVQRRAFGEAWDMFDQVDAATDKLAQSVRDELGFEVTLKITPPSSESSTVPSPSSPSQE